MNKRGWLLLLAFTGCGARSEGVLDQTIRPGGNPDTQSTQAPVCLGAPGSTEVLDSQAGGPIVLDGGRLFYNRASGGFWSISTEGGTPTKLDSEKWDVVGQSATHFFGNRTNDVPELRIVQMLKSGGPVQELGSIKEIIGDLWGSPAVDADGTIWFGTHNTQPPVGLWRKLPGKPETLVSKDLTNIWLGRSGETLLISYSEGTLHRFGRVEKDGSIVEIMSAEEGINDPLPDAAAFSRSFSWQDNVLVSGFANVLFSLDMKKPVPTPLVLYVSEKNDGYVALVWSDEAHFYFAINAYPIGTPGEPPAPSRLLRIPRKGGTAELLLIRGESFGTQLLGDDCNLYWIDDSGKLTRLRKP